jgi:hypothetical protein
MKKYLIGSLSANAATLGFHWIYNQSYLEELSKKQSLIFQPQQKLHFDLSVQSYYAYPKSKIGDVTTQGMFMKWLYKELYSHKDFSKKDYASLIYDHLRPGGDYEGYVETYGKKLLINQMNTDLKLGLPIVELNDDHLVGFVPYLVCKELGLPNEKAWELASLFTSKNEYQDFYNVFDFIFDHLQDAPLKVVLEQAIKYAPSHFENALKMSIEMTDTKQFIKEYAGIACNIHMSLPLIFHMLAHAKSFQELIEWNAKIGGASSDRGLILGAIMHQLSPVPPSWIKQANLD